MSRKTKSEFSLHNRIKSFSQFSESSSAKKAKNNPKFNLIAELQKEENLDRVSGDPFKMDNSDFFNFDKMSNNQKGNSNTKDSEANINTTKTELLNTKKSNIVNNISSKKVSEKKLSRIDKNDDYENLQVNDLPEIKFEGGNKITFNEYNDENKQLKTFNNDSIYDLDLNFVDEIKNSEKDILDDYETNECFIKLKLEEFNTALYTFMSIASALLYHDFKNYPENYSNFKNNHEFYNLVLKLSIIMVSLSVLMFSIYKIIKIVISSIFRYLIVIKLKKSNGDITKRHNLWSEPFRTAFIIEVLLALLHPNYGFDCIYLMFLKCYIK
jgi:uncharacterized membrane protein (DUF485 family)